MTLLQINIQFSAHNTFLDNHDVCSTVFKILRRMVIKIFGNMKTLVPNQDRQNPPGSPICMERTTLVFIIITVFRNTRKSKLH